MPPEAPPAPVSAPLATSPHHPPYILFAWAVIALIIVGGIAYYLFVFHPAGPATGAQILVTSDAAPVSEAVAGDATVTETLSLSGITGAILDRTTLATTTAYYLVADPAIASSNLYAADPTRPDLTPVQVTHSSTLKVSLSADPLSLSAAYGVVAGSDEHVVLFSQATGAETDLGEGSDPVLMPGGVFVVFRRNGSIVSLNTQNHLSYTLVSVATSSPFAIDPAHAMIALYEPLVGSVQTFSFPSMVTASYASSTSLTSVPDALTFVNGMVAAVTATAGHFVVTFPGAATASLSFPIPASGSPTHYQVSLSDYAH